MTVYLGDNGFVELKRSSGAPIQGTVGIADVNLERRRFSFPEFRSDELLTGDQVDILKLKGGNLDFIQGVTATDWRGYVFVDILGGIRLYNTFDLAVRGEVSEAVQLRVPGAPQEIAIQTRSSRFNKLAQVKQFDFTTERETIDITNLGDNFRKQYDAGLIQGQGRLDCIWDYGHKLCDPSGCSGAELPIYLAQLCIRLVQGADFFGRFFIYTPGGDDARANKNAVWYEAECVVTNVSISVAPTEIIESSIDFVTTGQFRLLIGEPPSFLLTEQKTRILLEENNDGGAIILSGTD